MRPHTKQLIIQIYWSISALFSICNGGSLPTIAFKDLLLNKPELVMDQNGQIGPLVVTNLGLKYQNAVEKLIQKAPECLGQYPKLPIMPLSDGSFRTTFASETGERPECLDSELKAISETFDMVDKAVSSVIEGKVIHFVIQS